jgi:uncharacterized RDD family membrane protein YckC
MTTRDRYDTFGPRFGAGIVDGLVFLPLAFVDYYLAESPQSTVVILLWGTFSYSACWLYSVLMHAHRGQTLGKMVTRVRVLDLAEARPPTLWQAFLRDSGYVALNVGSLIYLYVLVLSGRYSTDAEMYGAPAQILTWAGFGWLVLEMGTMVTNRKRRALHDYIAHTVVVRDAEQGVAAAERALASGPPARS